MEATVTPIYIEWGTNGVSVYQIAPGALRPLPRATYLMPQECYWRCNVLPVQYALLEGTFLTD